MYDISKINSLTCNLPKEELEKLGRVHITLMDLLTSLMKCTAKNSRSGAFYAFPGEQYLADKLGYARTYISAAVCYLEDNGYITITRRRKVSGRWQTNLYRIGIRLAQALRCVKSFVSSFLHRVNETRHIVNKPSIIIRSERMKSLLGSKSPPDTTETMGYIQRLGQKIRFRTKT